MKKFLVALIALLALLFLGCEDTSLVGTDLLDGEKFDISFVDDLDIVAYSIPSKLRKAYAVNHAVYSHLTGRLEDPVFGVTEASIYTRVTYNFVPDFKNVVLDSAVLIMAFDTAAYYGNPDALHDLQVFEITGDFAKEDTIYSTENFEVAPRILGESIFVARPLDSITIINHNDTTAAKIPAQVRIRIDDDWAKNLINNPLFEDDNLNGTDTALYNIFKGFKIENKTNDNALLGLSFTTPGSGQNSINSFVIYYTKSDGSKGFYNFTLNGGKFTQGLPDYSSAIVGANFYNKEYGDSLLFLQSFGGASINLDFTDLSSLDGKIINQAILDLTVAEIPEHDNGIFKPIKQLLAVNIDEADGKWNIIRDVQNLYDIVASSLLFGFGGNLITNSDTGLMHYQLNISNWIKERLDDPTLSRNLVITSNLTDGIKNVNSPIILNERANRSIIFGPKSSVHPLKLKVTYTNQ